MFRVLSSFFILFFLSNAAFAELKTAPMPSNPKSPAPAPAQAQAQTYEELLRAIREARAASKARVIQAVEQENVREAWETGKLIDAHVLQHKERADYGDYVIPKLSKDLQTSETEIKYMLQFARAYPIRPQGDELSWSHYRALLGVNDKKERDALAERASKEKWGRDRLQEEIKMQKLPAPVPNAPPKMDAPKPGKLFTYKVVRALDGPYAGKLVLDLGFTNYYRSKALDIFQAGDILRTLTSGPTEQGNTQMLEEVIEKEARDRDLYNYYAYVTGVIDGDTFKAIIDLGFGIVTEQKLRLRGLDAPEILTADGQAAKVFLSRRLVSSKLVKIRTWKSDKYDRYLADVFIGDDYVNQELINRKLAVPVRD